MQLDEILADPSDPRNAIVDEVRQHIARIEYLRSSGFDFLREFIDLQATILRWNASILAAPLRTGTRVIEGGRKGAAVAHGQADERAANRAAYVEAFNRVRSNCRSNEDAFARVASIFGVSARTIRRAVQK